MNAKIRELPGLRVVVDEVVSLPDVQGPDETLHRFAYFLTIVNDSSETVTIKGRKWVVSEKNGNVTVVEGDGVVGEFPCIAPGEQFSYDSSHLVAVDAIAEGALLGVAMSGEVVLAKIPPFALTVR